MPTGRVGCWSDQDAAYAEEYRRFVLEEVAVRESEVFGEPGRLTRAVAEGLFRAMAVKDEYEVARMHAAASYGPGEVFHMAPPLISRVDPETGRRRKVAIPGWAARPLFAVLQHGKKARGTAFDLFGRQDERKWERALIGQYREDVRAAVRVLRPEMLDVALGLAEIPDLIRGYGPVKEANRVKAMERRANLLARLQAGAELMAAE